MLDKLLDVMGFDGSAIQIWLFDNADIFYEYYGVLRAIFAGIFFAVLFNMFRTQKEQVSPSP